MNPRIFLFLFLPLTSLGQTTTSFFFPPALEFVLPKNEWKKEGLTYEEATWTPSIKKLVSKKGVVIELNCDIVEYLDVKPDSIFEETETNLKLRGNEYAKSIIHGFTVYSLKDNNSSPYYYSVLAIHPEGYYVSMNIAIRSIDKKESDAELEIANCTLYRIISTMT